uniref:Uncharacterized protein n=1 Tax=Candidatus Kentrum sp. FW TaxID=2126338 RepID=A0A450TQD3_9GAMM|nr:MAG: hypothetical protein BECKFW1821B_GA0114236_11802 [Candidatus Kentron sp. FW]
MNVDKKEPLLTEIEAFLDYAGNTEESPISGEAALEALKIVFDVRKVAQENQ